MKKELLFYGVAIVLFATVFGGCEKEKTTLIDETTIEDTNKDAIVNLPFFYVEKNDSVSKDVNRAKPYFKNIDEIEFVSSEKIENGLKNIKGNTPYVTDLYLLAGGSSGIQPPSDYTKIGVDLNKGAGGRYIYLCYTKQDVTEPLQGLSIYSGKNHYPKPSISYPWRSGVVTNNYGWGYPGYDLNDRAGGDWIFLYQTHLAGQYNTYEGNTWSKITQIGVYCANSSSASQIPFGWKRIPKDLNKRAGGKYVYIIYKTEN